MRRRGFGWIEAKDQLICVFIRVQMIEVLVVGNGIDQFLYIELKSQCPFALFECKCILCRKLPTCGWKRDSEGTVKTQDKVEPFSCFEYFKANCITL